MHWCGRRTQQWVGWGRCWVVEPTTLWQSVFPHSTLLYSWAQLVALWSIFRVKCSFIIMWGSPYHCMFYHLMPESTQSYICTQNFQLCCGTYDTHHCQQHIHWYLLAVKVSKVNMIRKITTKPAHPSQTHPLIYRDNHIKKASQQLTTRTLLLWHMIITQLLQQSPTNTEPFV